MLVIFSCELPISARAFRGYSMRYLAHHLTYLKSDKDFFNFRAIVSFGVLHYNLKYLCHLLAGTVILSHIFLVWGDEWGGGGGEVKVLVNFCQFLIFQQISKIKAKFHFSTMLDKRLLIML